MTQTEINTIYSKKQQEIINQLLFKELLQLKIKIVVLDDDPTGTQTVSNIKVYCDWNTKTLKKALSSSENIFFILTNSRSFSKTKTIYVHKEITKNILSLNKNVLFYSRGDSTLRGHYPTETETIKNEYENITNIKIDGEIICPFFIEGNRITKNAIHYIKFNDKYIPVGESEFAKDKTFGYKNSNLLNWCEEKTNHKYIAKNMIHINLKEIRNLSWDTIYNKFYFCKDFNKIIIDAENYYDLKIVTICFLKAINNNKHFIIRGAASLVKLLHNDANKPFLKKEDIIDTTNKNGGLIVIGSHVSKTTQQFEKLKNTSIKLIEFNQHLVLNKMLFIQEINRVTSEIDKNIKSGFDVVVYTRRERLDIPNGTKEQQLNITNEIANGLVQIVQQISSQPKFVITKGGITSSDVLTKGFGVNEALVLGQIDFGIPVWLAKNKKTEYPMPFIIFPGNVGDENSLINIYNTIIK